LTNVKLNFGDTSFSSIYLLEKLKELGEEELTPERIAS
jgi:hypothetical protein